MTTTPTTILSLLKMTYNTEAETWGTNYNSTLDLIDAATPGVKLLSGTVTSIGDLTLALSSSYTCFKLILTNVTSGASQVFLRLSNGSADPVTSSNYDYIRTDTTSASGGTQTYQGASTGDSVLLTTTIASQSADTAHGGYIEIDINTRAGATASRNSIKWEACYKGNASGLTVDSRGSGRLVGQTGVATKVKVGGYSALYTDGIRCSYVLIGIPSLA